MKNLRITVNGTAYDVQVEELGETAAPAAPAAAAAPAPSGKNPVVKAIIRTLIIFLICAVVGFGGMAGFFYFKGLLKFDETKPSEVVVESIRYVAVDGTSLYAQASENSAVIGTLAAGDVVQYIGDEGAYSKITTTGGVTGYVLSVNITENHVASEGASAAENPEYMSEEGELEVIDDVNSVDAPAESAGEGV